MNRRIVDKVSRLRKGEVHSTTTQIDESEVPWEIRSGYNAIPSLVNQAKEKEESGNESNEKG